MLFSPISALPLASLAALVTATAQRKHLLMALLALEVVILTVMLTLPPLLAKNNPNDTMSLLILLTFGACEACIGLACLVNLMRMKGNDLIKSSSSNMC